MFCSQINCFGLFFSQMEQAFETQSATLHSLRNYIGQLAPENGEKERLNDTVEVKAIQTLLIANRPTLK